MGNLKEGDEGNEEGRKNKNRERKYILESYHKTESILQPEDRRQNTVLQSHGGQSGLGHAVEYGPLRKLLNFSGHPFPTLLNGIFIRSQLIDLLCVRHCSRHLELIRGTIAKKFVLLKSLCMSRRRHLIEKKYTL